jgi:hypothetical protein
MFKPLFKYNSLKKNSWKSHDFGIFFSQKSFVWITPRYVDKHGTLSSEEKKIVVWFSLQIWRYEIKIKITNNKNKMELIKTN